MPKIIVDCEETSCPVVEKALSLRAFRSSKMNYFIYFTTKHLKQQNLSFNYKNTTGRNNQRCSRLNIKYTRYFDGNGSVLNSP